MALRVILSQFPVCRHPVSVQLHRMRFAHPIAGPHGLVLELNRFADQYIFFWSIMQFLWLGLIWCPPILLLLFIYAHLIIFYGNSLMT